MLAPIIFYLSAVSTLQMTKPSAGQINTSERPTFVWTDTASRSTYTLEVTTSSNCSSCDGAPRTFSVSTKSYTIPDGDLELMGDRCYCASVKYGAESSTVIFKTRPEDKPERPSLSVVPGDSSAQHPSGQSQILIKGTHGEEGATAEVYLKTSGDPIAVASTVIDGNMAGNFVVTVNVTNPSSAAGSRNYGAKIRRSASKVSDEATVSFYYDPTYSLPAPVISKEDSGLTGKIKWQPITGSGVTYEVYRRVGMVDGCGPSNACYFNKPFKRVTGTSSLSGGYVHFIDASVPSIPADGVSYFVVATNTSGERSNRSNALGYLDTKVPARTSGETVQIIATQTGRSVQLYYCGIDSSGFLNADNFPDLKARVRFVSKDDGNCGSASYSGGDEQELAFDALVSMTDASANITNCVKAGEVVDLNPDTRYCFEVCLKDSVGSEVTCSTGDKFTASDRVSPNFAGLTSASPLFDGRSVKVDWKLAKEDQTTREVIQYQIQKTTQLGGDGSPIFKDLLSDSEVSVVTGGISSVNLSGLETGAKYCFRATALDNASPANRNTPTGHDVCATTYDNRPVVQNITVMQYASDEPYKLPIQFQILDREAELTGHKVIFDGLSYRLNGGSWIAVEKSNLSGDTNELNVASSINSSRVNTIVFDSLPYFSGEQRIEFKIQVHDRLQDTDLSGNAVATPITSTSYAESQQTTIFGGMATISAFQDQSLSGCSLTTNAPIDAFPTLVLITLAIAFLIILRRKPS